MAPPSQPRRRRALKLPAVYPCEGIAPGPLLASLISLTADVAGADVGECPVLRRGVREARRLAGLLLSFLEEVRDFSMPLPGAAVLGLTELHGAMQKLRFLLADCARRGARVLVLANAGLVTSELRVVLGSVSTALDVLPREVVNASVEAGELARLMSEQAWRAVVRLDSGDDCVVRSVRSMLHQFKNGEAPDAADARRVLDHAGVASWSECSEEIAFLESELSECLEAGEQNSNDIPLLSGLVAFLVYCRVVLFDHIDKGKADSSPRRAPAKRAAEWVNLEALRCPITLELMTDPVTVSTGQTYDCASIKKWMKVGCCTCPVTGEPLRTTDVVPNAALRGIIERLLLSNGVSLPTQHRQGPADKAAMPLSPAAAGAARLAVSYVVAKLSRGSPEEQKKAACEARKLSKHSVFNRACLVETNAVPWLLCLLASSDAVVQDNAVAALLNLSKHPDGRKALVEAGGVGLVVDIINVGLKAEARQNAAAILFYLSSNTEYSEEIGRIPEAIPTLVQLMTDVAHRGRTNAMVSLYGLLQCTTNHAKAVAAGSVAVLANLLSGEQEDLVNNSVALLERIAGQPVGALAVLASPGILTRLAEYLGTSASRSGKDHCVSLLFSLCRHGADKAVDLLGRTPGLMTSLYSLVADGGCPQTNKKARSLLNEIHRHFELDQPSARAPASSDRVVHVL